MKTTEAQPPGSPAVSPWLQMAHDAARDWFRDHPGAPLADFTAWAEAYELEEALDAAWTGLMAARTVEERRRASVGDGGARGGHGTAGCGCRVVPVVRRPAAGRCR